MIQALILDNLDLILTVGILMALVWVSASALNAVVDLWHNIKGENKTGFNE